MRYGFMPRVMWHMFRGSFAKAAEQELGVPNGQAFMHAAHPIYRSVLSGVQAFDADSRFLVNILSCAMVVSVLKTLDDKPSLPAMTAFYKAAMCSNRMMKAFMRLKNSYSRRAQEKLRRDAYRSQSRANPYDWKFTFSPGKTLNQYTATFTTCGICTLMQEYGFYEYVPAMCALDYDMAAMNNTVFTREFTLASGGPYCDCHYDHRG